MFEFVEFFHHRLILRCSHWRPWDTVNWIIFYPDVSSEKDTLLLAFCFSARKRSGWLRPGWLVASIWVDGAAIMLTSNEISKRKKPKKRKIQNGIRDIEYNLTIYRFTPKYIYISQILTPIPTVSLQLQNENLIFNYWALYVGNFFWCQISVPSSVCKDDIIDFLSKWVDSLIGITWSQLVYY